MNIKIKIWAKISDGIMPQEKAKVQKLFIDVLYAEKKNNTNFPQASVITPVGTCTHAQIVT